VELEAFAPLVPDVHPGCGPLGGIEAALLHSLYEWNLFLPVDMPFVPASFLGDWVREVLATEARVALFTVDGRAQPTLCLLHREVAPFAQNAMAQGEHKLWPVLESAARELAARSGIALDRVLWNRPVEANAWFVNLNTPEEFAAAALGFVPPTYT
jgi:molybdopterin-guanine dinucleotide biosynthesis protein A